MSGRKSAPPAQLLRLAVQREFTGIARRGPKRLPAARLREVRADLRWLGPRPGDVTLDLACGAGPYTLELARQGGPVFGADLTTALLRQAVARSIRPHASYTARASRARRASRAGSAGGSTHFLRADSHSLPFPAASFDLLLCAFSFPHFAEPEQVVEEMWRVVRPHGRVALFEVVADCPVVERLERLRERVFTRVLATAEFLSLFAGAGFRLERFRHSLRRCAFRRWAASSNLAPGSPPLRRARRLLLDSAHAEHNPLRVRRARSDVEFALPVAAFLFRRLPARGKSVRIR